MDSSRRRCPFRHQLPADALHRAIAGAGQRRNLQDTIPGAQMRPDGVLDLGRYLRMAEPLPLLADTLQGRTPCCAEAIFHCSKDGAIWVH